VFYAIISLHF